MSPQVSVTAGDREPYIEVEGVGPLTAAEARTLIWKLERAIDEARSRLIGCACPEHDVAGDEPGYTCAVKDHQPDCALIATVVIP